MVIKQNTKICKFYPLKNQYTEEKHKWVCDPCRRFGGNHKLVFVKLCCIDVKGMRYTTFYCDLAESEIIKNKREFLPGL